MKETYILIAAAMLYGCSHSIEPNPVVPPPPAISDSTQLTDQVVLQAVYSTYKYPEGFYSENTDTGSIYYENTISILPVSQRTDHWFELSTDDSAQARAWSDSGAVNSSYYRSIVSFRETEKYFEFKRVRDGYPADVLLDRVHKSSYIDRSMYDRLNPGNTICVFNYRPLDDLSFKTLVEYLWYYDNYQLAGAKVLYVHLKDVGNSIVLTMFTTSVDYGDWGMHDAISLNRLIYTVDKSSGSVVFAHSVVRNIEGRAN